VGLLVVDFRGEAPLWAKRQNQSVLQ